MGTDEALQMRQHELRSTLMTSNRPLEKGHS